MRWPTREQEHACTRYRPKKQLCVMDISKTSRARQCRCTMVGAPEAQLEAPAQLFSGVPDPNMPNLHAQTRNLKPGSARLTIGIPCGPSTAHPAFNSSGDSYATLPCMQTKNKNLAGCARQVAVSPATSGMVAGHSEPCVATLGETSGQVRACSPADTGATATPSALC